MSADEDDRRLGRGDLNLPFQAAPAGQEMPADADAVLAGGLVVMAATIPVPGVGTKPALVFRFVEPHGVFHHPLVLVCEPDELAHLAQLVFDAIAAAIGAAR
jgi:hypothetical protein